MLNYNLYPFVIIQFIYFVRFFLLNYLCFLYLFIEEHLYVDISPLLYILFTAFNFYSVISIIILIYNLGLCVFLTKVTNSSIDHKDIIFFIISFLLFFLLILDMVSLCCPGWV